MTKTINIGDRLITKDSGNAHAMQVLRVVNIFGEGPDAVITYEFLTGPVYDEKGTFKKEQPLDTATCRGWWADEYCIVVRNHENGHVGVII